MTGRIFFYCQHLLGIGHLRRAATLARALAAAGHEVTLVSGGEEVPGLDVGGASLLQLDPVRAVDRYFKILVDSAGTVIDDAFKARRREALLAAFAERRPDLVLTEMFPFGRRQLRFELLPLLEAARAARPRPAIVSSVRDILVTPPKPERIEEMIGLIDGFYDAVLVHGDPDLIPFERTFPPAARIAGKLRYTGYVVDTKPPARGPGLPGDGEVVVSAGGGAVSEPLLEAAIAARGRSALANVTWRLLVGHNLPQDRFDRLRGLADAGTVVERARPDFTTLLANSRLSLSQGGYNTVMETLLFARRAVIVPYAGGLETEQTLRAKLLAERGLCVVVEESALTPERLVEAIDRALAMPEIPRARLFDVDGMAKAVRLVGTLLEARAAPGPAGG